MPARGRGEEGWGWGGVRVGISVTEEKDVRSCTKTLSKVRSLLCQVKMYPEYLYSPCYLRKQAWAPFRLRGARRGIFKTLIMGLPICLPLVFICVENVIKSACPGTRHVLNDRIYSSDESRS